MNIVSVFLLRGWSLRNTADLILSYIEHKSMKMMNCCQVENRAPLRPVAWMGIFRSAVFHA